MAPRGTLESDLELLERDNSSINKKWDSFEDMEVWKETEARQQGFEWTKSAIDRPRNKTQVLGHRSATHEFVCGRASTGGAKKYVPKTNRELKKGSKKLEESCPCKLRVHVYPSSEVVTGYYTSTHSHDLGTVNLPHTFIPKDLRAQIEGLLVQKVKAREIVRLL